MSKDEINCYMGDIRKVYCKNKNATGFYVAFNDIIITVGKYFDVYLFHNFNLIV